MYTFGKKSKQQLSTCHTDLVVICNQAIRLCDFSVLEGVRSNERQLQLFREGKSKLDGVNILSKHQANKDGVSMAVDIAPYPIDWHDHSRFYYLSGVMFTVAEYMLRMGFIEHRLRWGGDWDNDKDFKDHKFIDLPHFELLEIK